MHICLIIKFGANRNFPLLCISPLERFTYGCPARTHIYSHAISIVRYSPHNQLSGFSRMKWKMSEFVCASCFIVRCQVVMYVVVGRINRRVSVWKHCVIVRKQVYHRMRIVDTTMTLYHHIFHVRWNERWRVEITSLMTHKKTCTGIFHFEG